MILPPFNPRETDFNSDGIKRWFASIYAALTNIETINNIVIDASTSGVILKDTAGIYWKVTVTTSGVLTTTNLGSNKP